ncbi:MAG TPA: mechanosensitive ion channel family protein [Ferruginibacter sp.]|nr:mechanosensitive ion channel family protein [Ferruginibacter sp.]HMP20721.1 mechanosensitive ion channel family protein [Ferruginibacter sp.]
MNLTNAQLIEIAIAFGIAITAGWLFKKFLFPFLFKLTHKTKWKADDLIIENTGKWIVSWCILAAVLYTLPLLIEVSPFCKKYEALFYKIIKGFFYFSFTAITAKVLASLLEIRSKQDDSVLPSTSILGNIIKAIVYVIGFILILHNFGVAIAPLVTAFGVGGLAVALALQPTLSNLFSGLQIIASGKLNIGDLVQLENGQRGVVTDITWRNTVIKTAPGNLIIMPNSKMSDSVVENMYLEDRHITFFVEVGVSYSSNLEHVEQVCIETAKAILQTEEGANKDFEPFVRFVLFAESSITVRVFLNATEFGFQFLITSSFIKALHRRFNEEGIVIPFPIRTVYMPEEDKKTI